MKCDMDDKIKKELTGKVYGDYNALAINMGVGCDCDPEVKKTILDDLDGYVDCLKPDVKRFFVIDYFECLKPDKTMDKERREQDIRNFVFFCKCLKGYINNEWDVAYPLIEPTEANESVLLNDDRFWGKI